MWFVFVSFCTHWSHLLDSDLVCVARMRCQKWTCQFSYLLVLGWTWLHFLSPIFLFSLLVHLPSTLSPVSLISSLLHHFLSLICDLSSPISFISLLHPSSSIFHLIYHFPHLHSPSICNSLILYLSISVSLISQLSTPIVLVCLVSPPLPGTRWEHRWHVANLSPNMLWNCDEVVKLCIYQNLISHLMLTTSILVFYGILVRDTTFVTYSHCLPNANTAASVTVFDSVGSILQLIGLLPSHLHKNPSSIPPFYEMFRPPPPRIGSCLSA